MSWMRKNYNPKIHTLYVPVNIDKYKGGGVPLVMRSKYELHFSKWCDATDAVIWWSNENIKVPYFHPIKRKVVGYWPDFIICINNKIIMIELKPEREVNAPRLTNRKSLLNEQGTFMVNMAKWRSAKKYCDERNWEFKIITNESLIKRKQNGSI